METCLVVTPCALLGAPSQELRVHAPAGRLRGALAGLASDKNKQRREAQPWVQQRMSTGHVHVSRRPLTLKKP